MFSTIFSAGPRSGVAWRSAGGRASTGVGAGARAGAGAALVSTLARRAAPSVSTTEVAVAVVRAPLPVVCVAVAPSPPSISLKYDRHESSTRSGLLRKRSSRPWTYRSEEHTSELQ